MEPRHLFGWSRLRLPQRRTTVTPLLGKGAGGMLLVCLQLRSPLFGGTDLRVELVCHLQQ